jgi:hypothetical protein
MAMTAQEYEKDFLDNIESKTNNTLKGWMGILKAKAFTKPKEAVDWLKTQFKLNHAHADMLAGIYLNGGKPVYGDKDAMMDALFKGKDSIKELFDIFQKEANSSIKGLIFLPTKTYVSIRGVKEFAVASIKSKEMRIGLDLGSVPFSDYLLPAKSLGAMPRFSHMIVVTDKKEISKELLNYFNEAYKRLHK